MTKYDLVWFRSTALPAVQPADQDAATRQHLPQAHRRDVRQSRLLAHHHRRPPLKGARWGGNV